MKSAAVSRRPLSRRLIEVITLAQSGLGDREISAQLGISVNTIKVHWRRLRERYGANNRSEVIARYLSESLNAESEELRTRQAALEAEILTLRSREAELLQSLQDVKAEARRQSTGFLQALDQLHREQVASRERTERLELLFETLEQLGFVVHAGKFRAGWEPLAFAELGGVAVLGRETWDTDCEDLAPVTAAVAAATDPTRILFSRQQTTSSGGSVPWCEFLVIEPGTQGKAKTYWGVSVNQIEWPVVLLSPEPTVRIKRHRSPSKNKRVTL